VFHGWLYTVHPTGFSFAVWYLVPVLALLLLVGVLRRWPFAVLTLLMANLLVLEFAGPDWDDTRSGPVMSTSLLVAIDVVVGHIAGTRRRWVSVATAVAVALAQIALVFGGTDGRPDDRLTWATLNLVAVLAAWLVGNTVRQRRQFADAQLAAATRTAVQTERLRIARELHDLVAHSIGVIAMQAGMGRRVIDSQPEEARTALGVIEDTGRETLAALRRMLGTLRQADPDDGEMPRDPAPGLADLERLAERSRAAGLRIDIRDSGEQRPLPPDVDLSAYRIVQEAVTNVARHAGTDRCDILVDRRPALLVIDVVDNGLGGAPGPGYGIAGMRERVSLLHGEFAAGPRPEGGFRVTARIPIPAAG
jgi:signal transduction histidine kinase